jgi:hypothetical protein
VRDESGRPCEKGYFILDIRDKALTQKAERLYGKNPASLNITFFSNNLADIFKSTLQRWGTSKKGVPYLMCEGNRQLATSEGKTTTCPCNYFGRECRRKTTLKFLIPDISLFGFFLLTTKSEHSADEIATQLALASRLPQGLIMQPFRLRRTEGFAQVNGIKTKKYYVSLEAREPKHMTPAGAPEASMPEVSFEGHQQESYLPSAFVSREGMLAEARREQARMQDGRNKVKGKLRCYIMDPNAEKALEEYACHRFNKASFDDLTRIELLELWHDISDKSVAVEEIFTLSKKKDRVSNPHVG